MSVVDPNIFAPHLSLEEVWNTINALPVKFQDFAEMSHYYSRLYDVITGATEGGDWKDIAINDCLRNNLWRKLHEVTVETELRMGYNLTTSYHYEEVTFPEFGKGMTRWPGVSSFGVRPSWAAIADYGPFSISAVAVSGATVNDADTQPIVLADASIFENPLDVQMRNGNNGNTYTPLALAGYPKRNGANWEIPIDVKRSSFDPVAPVDLQHRKLLILDVDPPAAGTVPAGATVYPVYPGTNQIIPQARPSRVLGNGKVRYTFYIYTLVHPAFRFETINLERGEYYKLYPEIELKALSETSVQAQVVWTKGGTSKVIDVTLLPALSGDGIFHIVFDGEIIVDPLSLWVAMDCDDQYTPESLVLKYWYKTDPKKLDEQYSRQIPALRQAICHRTAAELPVLDCGCRVGVGFIFENQKRFDDIQMKGYPGFEIRSSKFSDTYGRLRYEEILASQFYYSRLAVI